MTGGSVIDYEALAQDAMRGIVRSVLYRAVKTGLPGDHHFYIAFDTRAPGSGDFPPAQRKISGRDDDRPAAPVLGLDRFR